MPILNDEPLAALRTAAELGSAAPLAPTSPRVRGESLPPESAAQAGSHPLYRT
jgi:hypothetical protein